MMEQVAQSSARASLRRAFVLSVLFAVVVAQSSCSWVTGEFATLDRLPKSCRPDAQDSAAAGSASRP